jgi:hypothetical protein
VTKISFIISTLAGAELSRLVKEGARAVDQMVQVLTSKLTKNIADSEMVNEVSQVVFTGFDCGARNEYS